MPHFDLSESFEQNLAAYVEANAVANPSKFRVSRELDVARYALEESLSLHAIATKLLKVAINKLSESESDLIKLVALANSLEERHNRLLQSSRQVAHIAKTGAEIESLLTSKLDASQVYSIIAQLPSLLLSLISSLLLSYFRERNLSIVNGQVLNVEEVVQDVANLISASFNDELEKNVNVLTYSQSASSPTAKQFSGNGASPGGIIESQVVAMLNSVPLSVVPPNDPVAQEIQRIGDVELHSDDGNE